MAQRSDPQGDKTVAPYGTWASPISVESLTEGAVSIGEVIPEDNALWWSQSRPDQGGRTAIMRHQNGEITEVTPGDANVRTLVHEYGGGAWWVHAGVCYYVDFTDQRIRSLVPGQTPQLLSPEPPTPRGLRYADFRLTEDGLWLIAVEERWTKDAGEPANTLVAVATDGSMRKVTLASGADFYHSPRLSPDGTQLCWIEWQHPNMPWDDTTLQLADIRFKGESPTLGPAQTVAGGQDEAVVQPLWSPGGTLHYLSDRSDNWQVYALGSDSAVT
ncbi:MAG: S9 family peptidase, partial [Gammaproteobacteria bacterium]|nr:S9 family peptidase [Gammaproteobacteria bacterium]